MYRLEFFFLKDVGNFLVLIYACIFCRITQTVLWNHRCDGVVDCEDGTDEQACDCKTRLENIYDSRGICDGVINCSDGTDEMTGCVALKCKRDEMACGWPKKCVKASAWCDGKIDCVGGDDEKYCSKDRCLHFLII